MNIFKSKASHAVMDLINISNNIARKRVKKKFSQRSLCNHQRSSGAPAEKLLFAMEKVAKERKDDVHL